jgi:predicted Zn-dependent peptidase
MLVVVAGDAEVVEQAATLKLIEKMFAKGSPERHKLDKKKSQARHELEENPISDKKLHVEFRKTEQAHLIMGWPGMKRAAKERYALSLLSTILGGNMSSRLFIEVREKRGLCYYVHSDVDQYHNAGFFGASAGVDQTRVEEAIKIIRAEFEAAATGDRPITAKELQKAKDYVAGKMVLGLEDSESVAQFFGMKQLMLDEIASPEETLKRYNKVTLEEVQSLLVSLVKPGELRLAVIGPYENSQPFAELIK